MFVILSIISVQVQMVSARNMLTKAQITLKLDCGTASTEGQILEIPYGRAAGALMVTSGGNTETCVQTIGECFHGSSQMDNFRLD